MTKLPEAKIEREKIAKKAKEKQYAFEVITARHNLINFPLITFD